MLINSDTAFYVSRLQPTPNTRLFIYTKYPRIYKLNQNPIGTPFRWFDLPQLWRFINCPTAVLPVICIQLIKFLNPTTWMTTSYLYFSDSRIWLIVCSVNLEMSRTDSYARLSCDLVGLKKCYFQQLNRKCDKNAKTLLTTKFVFWVKFFFLGGGRWIYLSVELEAEE